MKKLLKPLLTKTRSKDLKMKSPWLETRRKKIFNDTLSTFYLWLHGIGHMLKYNSDSERGNLLPPLHGDSFQLAARNEWMNECLTTPQHEKQIGYWVSVKGKCMKWLAARILLYAPSHRQDSTYQSWSTGWNRK